MREKLQEFKNKGYTVLDNFLPEEIADELNLIYKNQQDWEQIDQVRENHYKHVFATDSIYLPNGDESYMAKFGRAKSLEASDRVNRIYDQYFKPHLVNFSGVDLKKFDVRCYQLKQGDFYRSHVDDYAGSIGCVYYVNKKWVWDWGGLLHIAADDDIDSIESILPKFNRAVLLDHKKFRFPHFVSTVSDYAKEPRYSIVSFNG